MTKRTSLTRLLTCSRKWNRPDVTKLLPGSACKKNAPGSRFLTFGRYRRRGEHYRNV